MHMYFQAVVLQLIFLSQYQFKDMCSGTMHGKVNKVNRYRKRSDHVNSWNT